MRKVDVALTTSNLVSIGFDNCEEGDLRYAFSSSLFSPFPIPAYPSVLTAAVARRADLTAEAGAAVLAQHDRRCQAGQERKRRAHGFARKGRQRSATKKR